MPRFEEDNLPHNLELVAGLRRLAVAEGCTPTQLALAWVLSRGPWVVPIAGDQPPALARGERRDSSHRISRTLGLCVMSLK